MANASIQLRNVTKVYDNGVAALGPLDLTIDQGEFVALLGPSGCGKSTALRLIAGLSDPSSGTVSIPMRETGAQSVGFVFQDPTLMPWANVRDNVRLPLRLGRHVKADMSDEQIDAVLARVGLEGFGQVYPRELSGGMRMRTSIARALVTDPDILLMDEPFAALDEITRFRLNNSLLEVWSALGKTVIFVTHSVFESVYLAQRVVVLTPRPGRIFAQFTIEAPAQRDESFRTSPEYVAQCRIVSAALEQAMSMHSSPEVRA